eukprot:jgi/Botrbrau1/18308/Bobra.0179s0037.1
MGDRFLKLLVLMPLQVSAAATFDRLPHGSVIPSSLPQLPLGALPRPLFFLLVSRDDWGSLWDWVRGIVHKTPIRILLRARNRIHARA